MTDLRISGHNVIVGYAWEFAEANGVLAKIGGKVPFAILNDEPAFSETDQDYVIYGYTESMGGDLREVRDGTVAFRVRSKEATKLSRVLNALSRAFELADVSAENINLWSTSKPHFHGIRILFTDVVLTDVGDPGESETDYSEAVININYQFVVDHRVKVFNPKDSTWK